MERVVHRRCLVNAGGIEFRAFFKGIRNTFVCCEAERRIDSWTAGKIARQIVLPTTPENVELGHGK